MQISLRHLTILAVVLALAALAQPTPVAAAASSLGQQTPGTMKRNNLTISYLLYLPKDYDRKPSWPLMLFLHGAGERGNDLELVQRNGPPKLIHQGHDFPFLVLSPQCPKGQYWEPAELSALLDEILEKYKVDQDRVYLTGISMGGFGTWALAAYEPRRFAALVPICGGAKPSTAKQLHGIPTWVFHGAKDNVVPLEYSEEMVDALKKAGGNVKFTVYPNAGHDSWTETYNNPELYKWLLEQKRPAKVKR